MRHNANNVSAAKRSQIMSAVRSYGNKATEGVFVKLMRQHGITGWSRRIDLVGKPDFVFKTQRVALFVDGCFWHGCPKHCRMPKSNQSYWFPKIRGNRRRDQILSRTLRRMGWHVLRVWEHELSSKNQVRLMERIRRALGPE